MLICLPIPLEVLHQHGCDLHTRLLSDDCWDRMFSAEAFCAEKDSRAVQLGRDKHVLRDQASNFVLMLLVVAWRLGTSIQYHLRCQTERLDQQAQDFCLQRLIGHQHPHRPVIYDGAATHGVVDNQQYLRQAVASVPCVANRNSVTQ